MLKPKLSEQHSLLGSLILSAYRIRAGSLLPIHHSQGLRGGIVQRRIVIFLIHQQGQYRSQRVDLLLNFYDLELFLLNYLVDVPHGSLQELSWDGREAYRNQLSQAMQTQRKSGPNVLGPLFKEAERREVREDFARCRSGKQSDYSEVVENYVLW